MSLLRNSEYIQILIDRFKDKNAYAIDMSLGNGNDTYYLASHFKHIYAFDIQEEAINNSKEKLSDFDNVSLFLDSHLNFDKYVNNNIKLVIFNLGYLPNFSKSITTQAKTTLQTLKKTLIVLDNKGIVIISIYPGHDEGKKESELLLEYLNKLDNKKYHISKYETLLSNEAPYVIAVYKK